METEKKYVTYKQLKKGQEIQGWENGNSSTLTSAIVKEINPAFVSVMKWGRFPEQIPAEDTKFIVYMNEEEFKNKYQQGAKDIIKALENMLCDYEIGSHEMWNSWVYYDPFQMAKACKKNKIRIIGLCENVYQRYENEKDVGICAEDEDGTKFWCHASEDYITRMIKVYKYLIDK